MKLGRWSDSVRVVSSGSEALVALDAGTYDVLFTDVQMPDMDGYELTAAVRAREAGTGRRLPVIAMTAHAMQGVREQCLAAGMDDYVSKPVRDEDLLAALRRAAGSAAASPPGAKRAVSDTFGYGEQDTGEFALPSAPAFDEKAVLARVGGNRELLADLVEVLYQDCGTQMAELETSLRTGDARGVQSAAHTIKGMVNFFGAARAADAARRLELAGERGELSGAVEAFAELSRELEALTAALTPYAPAPASGRLTGAVAASASVN